MKNKITPIEIKAEMSKENMRNVWENDFNGNNIKKNEIIRLEYLGNPYFYDLALQKVPPELIYIIEDEKSRFLYEDRTDILPGHIEYISDNNKIKDSKLMKVHVHKSFINPPYDGRKNLYVTITAETKRHSDEVICLSPYIAYISRHKRKYIIPDVTYLENHAEAVKFVPGLHFDAAFDKPLAIFKFVNKKTTNLKFDELFYENRFSDIKLTKQIFQKFINYSEKYDNCLNHIINKKDFSENKKICAFTGVRGNTHDDGTHKWDWTTIFGETQLVKFDYKSTDKGDLYGFEFDTIDECKSMINYWDDPIIMFALYIVKISMNNDKCLFETIPYITENGLMANHNKIISTIQLTEDEVNYINNEMKDYGYQAKK